jgi:hypothetical protein
LILGLLKYVTKESDLVANREWFLEYTRQLHKMRAVATGGVLKEYLKEPEDLIGESNESTEDVAALYVGWRRQKKRCRTVD